ncbi:uncharacterized protein [Amphiura filiformis]|uniref:uncharacterized protein isoform X2 n=1 Tax=Amphiura filiformis TaxID=82378 RepID=UPI003B21DFBB
MWQRQAIRRYRHTYRFRPFSRYSPCCLYYSLGGVFIIYLSYIFYNPERYVNKFDIEDDDDTGSSKMPLSVGAIVGIVIGVTAIVIFCIGVIVFCFCMLDRRQQVLRIHQHSIPGAGTYMPQSEYGRSAGVAYPKIWNNTYKYKMNQAPTRVYYRPSQQQQQQQQQYPHTDPRLRHIPQRNGSFGQGPGPTVFVYQSDETPSNAPRFYWRDEAQDVTESAENRDGDSHSGETSPKTNDPIIEFPDDDDDDNATTGNHYDNPDVTEVDS